MDQIAAFKEGNRATWASGDYPSIAENVRDVGRRIVDRVEVGPGDEVLDVACGAGNAAIPAAAAGGRVVGLDLTPELFEAGRAKAAEAGVEVEWIEGDAEALPFGDASFDVVLSTFGCMFAPRHDVTARELARVIRPGGRMGLCTWTPEGNIGTFFRTVGSYMPPPPEFASPPPLWGAEEHVRELFADSGLELEFDREVIDLEFDSLAAGLEEYETKFGPLVRARELLEPEGKWMDLHSDLERLFAGSVGEDGRVIFPAEYLVVVGRRPA
jgi:SAM-dependent methyltransferase